MTNRIASSALSMAGRSAAVMVLVSKFHIQETGVSRSKSIQSETSISFFAEAPAGIRLKQWPTLERNGFVCVWHHAEGEEPHWFPPATAEIESGDWQYGGRTENIVNCHLQEIPENGADIGHLNQIHAPSMIWGKFFSSWTRTAIMNFLFGAHEWSAEWHADDVEQHLARIRIVQDFSLFGRTLISLDISVTQVGSSLVLLRFTCPQYNISGLFSQAVISVASNKQRVIHHVYLKQSIFGRLFSRLLLFGEANMVSLMINGLPATNLSFACR